jgi:hypothetical protein
MDDLTVLGGLHSRYGIRALEKGSRFGCMTSSVRRAPRCRLFDSTLIFNRGWSVCCILSIVRTGNASLRRWRAGRRAENRIRGPRWEAPLLLLDSILGNILWMRSKTLRESWWRWIRGRIRFRSVITEPTLYGIHSPEPNLASSLSSLVVDTVLDVGQVRFILFRWFNK